MNDSAVLAALMSSPSAAVVAADLDGVITGWSWGAAELYGWSAEQIIGRSLTVLAPDGLVEELASIRAAVAAGLERGPIETVRRAADGSAMPVQMHALTVRGPDGSPVGTVAVHRDLRRANRAEAALAASEDELRARFAESPVPQSRIDPCGTVLAVNAAMEQLLGRPAREIVGTDVLGHFADADRDELAQVLDRLASGAVPYVRQDRVLVRADGQHLQVVISVTSVRDAAGRLQLTGTVEDVTRLHQVEAAERAQAEQFDALLRTMPVTVFTYDVAGRCTSSRGQALRHIGEVDGQLVGTSLVDDQATELTEAVRGSLAGAETQAVLDVAGRVWDCRYGPVRDDSGVVVGGLGIALDITERAVAEREVRANADRLRALLSRADDVVVVLNEQGRLLYVSPAVTRVLGHDDVSLFWQPASELNHPEDRAAVAGAWRSALAADGAMASVTCRVRHADGSWRWCEHVLTNRLADPDVGGMVINLRDVTEQRSATAELQWMGLHDGLTGLANRALLLDRTEQALRWSERTETQTGLVLLDVVDMALINKTVGHQGGDVVLQQVADRLREAVRGVDSVARAGGDVFAVLVEDVASTEELRSRAATFRDAAQGPVTVGTTTVTVGLRAGSALTPAAGAGALLAAAERSVPAGGPVSPGILVEQAAIEGSGGCTAAAATAELAAGIARGELCLRYQPVVRLASGQVVGAEALVRWQHPARGLLAPADFVPLAESSGLVVELGTWVLRAACAQAAAWAAAGRPISVGVNLSPCQLVGDSFPDLVRRVLAETGLDPARLVLEVTESSVMDDAGAPAVLRSVKHLGVRLALDDFGTGYSSLTYLKLFPVDAIKIDKSFVAGLGRDRDDEAIVASIASLGRAIGKTVVAEGVETTAQLDALAAYGVDQAQGYLWSRPVAAATLETWMQQQEREGPALARPRPEPTVAAPVRHPAAGPVDDEDVQRVLALHGDGASLHTIAAALNVQGRRTPTGSRWTTTTVARVIADQLPR